LWSDKSEESMVELEALAADSFLIAGFQAFLQ
jgi:hypothetical protein